MAAGKAGGGGGGPAGAPRWAYALVAWALLLQVLLAGLPCWPWAGSPRPPPPPQGGAEASEGSGGSGDGGGSKGLADAAKYFRPMEELVRPHGYGVEEHFVTTQDGYVLRLFRIVPPPAPAPAQAAPAFAAVPACNHSSSGGGGSFGPSAKSAGAGGGRPLVFLQHALMDSSAGWLLLGRRSLALALADAGCDVWMGNARGNRFSRNHTALNPDRDAAFWRFSVDEQAAHDLPASVGRAMAVSGQRRLAYVGYSQGTMVGLAALSSQPRLAAAVSLAVLIAPVAFTTAMASPAFVLSARLGLDRFALSQGWGEWGSFQQANADAMRPLCRRLPSLCLAYFQAFCGRNPRGNIDPALAAAIFQHLSRFDFGTDCSGSGGGGGGGAPRCNMEAYGGRAVPPAYDLGEITTPVALFTGGRDSISRAADVSLLRAALRPGVLHAHHHYPDYAHLDFELGSDAPDLAYKPILSLLAAAGA